MACLGNREFHVRKRHGAEVSEPIGKLSGERGAEFVHGARHLGCLRRLSWCRAGSRYGQDRRPYVVPVHEFERGADVPVREFAPGRVRHPLAAKPAGVLRWNDVLMNVYSSRSAHGRTPARLANRSAARSMALAIIAPRRRTVAMHTAGAMPDARIGGT